FREKVVNSIGATGYFQILTSVHGVSIEDMQNGYANAGYAYSMYLTQGLAPWYSSKSCWSQRI
ncbi:MAG: transglycosylase, partial [Thaumarchaeota archaeon]|nr:transglycosylase [Nitrososphaerota archaeon]